jgi:hypothetical protein
MTVAELGTAILSLGALQGLTAIWLKGRFEATLKHTFDRKLEDLKFEIRQREQAAMMAELLSEWVANNPPDKKRLNRLTWEASLWLPEDVARDLCATLNHKPGAKSVKELLIEVRKILKGPKDGFTAASIIHFS